MKTKVLNGSHITNKNLLSQSQFVTEKIMGHIYTIYTGLERNLQLTD